MIEVTINGEKTNLDDNTTITQYLDNLNIQLGYAAIAVNQDIISKHKYHEYQLKEGDIIEVLTPMQGG